jgi:hypothetical protein
VDQGVEMIRRGVRRCLPSAYRDAAK